MFLRKTDTKKMHIFRVFEFYLSIGVHSKTQKMTKKNTCFLRSKKDDFCDIKNGIGERPFFEE